MSELAPRLLVIGHDPESGALGEALDASEFDPEVVTVEDRAAAVEILRRERFDCVVSGYDVPDEDGRTYMGGLRLLETVREEHDDLPFVIFTDVVNEDSLRLAAANGVRAYVRDQAEENVVGQLQYHVDSAIRGRLAERRAAEQDRINELMRGVTQTLVLEEDRGPMLASLCRKLTEQDIYRFAAYHRRGPTGLDVEPEAVAGTAAGDAGATALLRRSVERGEVETARIRRSVDGIGAGEAGDGSGDDGGARANDGDRVASDAGEAGGNADRSGGRSRGDWETVLRIAVPISYEGERFGVLVLETDPEHAFFESETAVLAELGEAIGHALNAVETREALRERERELEHQTEQLEGFAGIVSHDVRNPLNVAQGYVELLKERTDDEAVDEIDESLDRIETIVADILALTRGERELDLAPTELDAVVDDAWANVDTTGATLEAAGLPRVEADASQLQRVFENVFRNSIEHGMSDDPAAGDAPEDADGRGTPDTEESADPTLTVRVAFEDGELVVEDDGVGFPEGAAEELFDLGETGSSGGTGIGLAVVGGLLEQHGWTVHAENRESGGARFRIGGVEPLA